MKAVKKNPLVLITGATGNIGQALARALKKNYRVVGLDRPPSQDAPPCTR